MYTTGVPFSLTRNPQDANAVDLRVLSAAAVNGDTSATQYQMSARVEDNGAPPLFSYALITVTVDRNPVGPNFPIINKTVSITENRPGLWTGSRQAGRLDTIEILLRYVEI